MSVTLDFIITISAVIIFLICLNLAICPFLIYFFPDLVFNNSATNALCYLSDNQIASDHDYYFQNTGTSFSQTRGKYKTTN